MKDLQIAFTPVPDNLVAARNKIYTVAMEPLTLWNISVKTQKNCSDFKLTEWNSAELWQEFYKK